eukprot:TRINITY_DN2697_c0_g3_i1.p1 TRINITY_DN2697_c0_g3~~TRINITY_DN2697_c0_g3_i1.p1  ORF type:complete len:998 (+),score=239.41 TRINITY_DN2697_c0_g3_i1:56-3049(+)
MDDDEWVQPPDDVVVVLTGDGEDEGEGVAGRDAPGDDTGKPRLPTLDTAKRVARMKRAELRRGLIIRAHSGHCVLVLTSLAHLEAVSLSHHRRAVLRARRMPWDQVACCDPRVLYEAVADDVHAGMASVPRPLLPSHPHRPPTVPSLTGVPRAGDAHSSADAQVIAFIEAVCRKQGLAAHTATPPAAQSSKRGRGKKSAPQVQSKEPPPAEEGDPIALPTPLQRYVDGLRPEAPPALAWAALADAGYVLRPVMGVRMSCAWTTALRRVGRFFESAADAAVLGKPPPLFEPPKPAEAKRGGRPKRAPQAGKKAPKAAGKAGGKKRKAADPPPAKKKQKTTSASAPPPAGPAPKRQKTTSAGGAEPSAGGAEPSNVLVLDDDDDDDLFSFESVPRGRDVAGSHSPCEASSSAVSDASSEASDGDEAPSPGLRTGCSLLVQTVDQLLDAEHTLLSSGGQEAIESNAAVAWSAAIPEHRPKDPVQAVLKAYDDESSFHESQETDHKYECAVWWEVLYSDGHFRPLPFDADTPANDSLGATALRREQFTYVFTHFLGCFVDVTAKYCGDYMKALHGRVETLDIPKEANDEGIWERYQVPDGSDGENLAHPERMWLRETLERLNAPAMVAEVTDAAASEDAPAGEEAKPAAADTASGRPAWVDAFFKSAWRGAVAAAREEAAAAAAAKAKEEAEAAKKGKGRKSTPSPAPPAPPPIPPLAPVPQRKVSEAEEPAPVPPPPVLPEHVRHEVELLRRLRYKRPPPATHKELSKHNLYSAKTLLLKAEAIVPWAVPFCKTHLYEIYTREDVSRLRGREAWRRYGREVRPGEKAVRRIPAQSGFLSKAMKESGPLEYQNGKHLIDVFGSWQTKVYTAPVNLTQNAVNTKTQKSSRDREGTFSLADGPLPPNLAHVRGHKVDKLCVALKVPYAKALVSFTRHAGWSRPNFDGVVVEKADEARVLGAVMGEELLRKVAADKKRSEEAIKRWGRLVFHLKMRLNLHAKYL